ncbi:chemotaxis protein CheR, partial [filamentous cyanobacterium CCP5]
MSQPSDSDAVKAEFQALLEYVRDTRGFDFTGYKPSTLQRRFRKRMKEVNVEDYANYQDYLEVHPDEFDRLFNTLLINVTRFMRDPEAWETLQHQAIPDLLRRKPETDPIRIWSVGCSSGEEAYTIAIILGEILGPQAFRQRVKIYATDIDEEALSEARYATYDVKRLEPL